MQNQFITNLLNGIGSAMGGNPSNNATMNNTSENNTLKMVGFGAVVLVLILILKK